MVLHYRNQPAPSEAEVFVETDACDTLHLSFSLVFPGGNQAHKVSANCS